MPIAIVSSLAYTLDKDLYWDKIPQDSAQQVVSRGILYLLIFAQYISSPKYKLTNRLGLMIRWSYGYRYLLAPEEGYKLDLEHEPRRSVRRSLTMESDENTPLLVSSDTRQRFSSEHTHSRATSSHSETFSDYNLNDPLSTAATSPLIPSTPSPVEEDNLISFPPHDRRETSLVNRIQNVSRRCWREFLEFMNMPLWAMLIAVLVALFPKVQHYLFFKKDGFIRGSVIYAIRTCGDVSIPLILVILGANIANEDPPAHEENGAELTDQKVRCTQRQRAIILGVATRMIIVPVPLLLIVANIVNHLSTDDSRGIMGSPLSHGRPM